MSEKGAHIIASFYGAPNGPLASSPVGWCYRRRRPLFALCLLLVVSLCDVESLLPQRVGDVRLSVLTGPESGDPYLLLEYRGREPIGIRQGARLLVSARTLIHAYAAAVSSEEICDPECFTYECALFHVKRSDLSALARSSTAAIVLMTDSGPLVGRLELAHLAPIRKYVQQNPPKPQT